MADDLQRKIIAKVYSRVSVVVAGLCDEGDRVYFDSSNDADILRDLSDEWAAHKIMGEDILSSEQEVAALKIRAKADAARITTLEAQNRKLVVALIAADVLQDALVKYLNAPGGLPREVYAALLTYKTTRAAIAEAEKGEG